MWRLVILLLSTALVQSCKENKFLLQPWDQFEIGLSLVYYTESPCTRNPTYYHFCEGSGWGNEEATVACRELGYQYGIGRYIRVQSNLDAYGEIECQGNETKLEECIIRKEIHSTCRGNGVVSHCSNVSQVFVAQVNYIPGYGHYLTVWEADGNVKVCLKTNGMITDPLYIDVETTDQHANTTLRTPATAGVDYRKTAHTLMLNETVLQQCLEIAIINDSMPERQEVFTLLLSTNNSAVNLSIHRVDVYIIDGYYQVLYVGMALIHPWTQLRTSKHFLPQVYVAQTRYNNSWGGYYLTVNESDGNVPVCLQIIGIVREALYIHVETTHKNSSDYPPAIADNDYKATASTLVFEPSDEIVLQQCLKIKIINDSLPEGWEVFTLLLSTNNSAVDLVTDRVNVYIIDVPPQVFVAQIRYDPKYGHYLTVQEADGNIQVCLQINGIIREPLYVHVETTHTNSSGYTAAIADYDYKATSHTVMFEPSNEKESQQLLQCLEIEIFDDSLPEDWEVFTLLLSTNNSGVNLTLHRIFVYINPNSDSSCPGGSVTVVSDVNNSSLQLVEICNSEGVWSPVCDKNWTLQDTSVVCRELDNQDMAMYAVINNSMGSGSVTYECEGHETRLSDCMRPLSSTIVPCYYALVKCFSTTDNKSGGSNKTSDKKSGGITTSGSFAGIMAGVVVSLIAVMLVVTIVIIILIVWLKRRAKTLKPGDNNASTTSPKLSTPVTAATEASDVTMSLGNPTYEPTAHIQPAQTVETPHYNFVNPLYSTATEAVLTEM